MWPHRQSLQPGMKNVQNNPLVDPQKVLLPPLHIKLGLMKNFVKAINKNGTAFHYLRQKFPRLSEAKIKEGIFVGPQIRNLLKDEHFDTILEGKEKKAWDNFRLVTKNFLGNKKSDNYSYAELIENMLSSYQELGCNMSLKILFLSFYILIWTSFRITVRPLAMNMGSASTGTSLTWKNDIRASGTFQC